MRKINIATIFLLLLVSTITSPVNAASDGKDSEYFDQNVGVKVQPKTPLNGALTVNGNILINDGTQALNYILGTDPNGHAFWSDARNFPEFDGNGKLYNHIIVENGFFQDLTLNGLITVNGRLSVPGIANGYILTMQTNGNAHWGPNYGSNGTSNDPLWQEAFNTIFPKTNGGEMNLVIGDNNTAAAEIVFTKNGAAAFNRGQASTEDFNVGTNQSFFGIKVETDDDQVGIRMGSPDTRLDVNGMFGLRSDGTDYTVSPDSQSSVYWVAQGSSMGNNGDVLARINNGAEDKLFKLVDFFGTTNGVKTQNGVELTNLTANRLVASDANKALVSEEGIRVAGTGYVGFATSRPLAKAQVADAILNHVDGIDDLSVEGDIEADGTIYATNFVGDTIGLHFNGVTIRNAKIYTSTIFEILDFNGGAQIRPFDNPLYLDANLEFKGNSEYRTGNRFQLRGAPSENPEVSFHVANGRVGINTITPTAEFDLNATLAIRDGSQQNGFVLRAVDSIGNTQWEFIDSENVVFAANAGNATTANFADAMINGMITDSDFINGNINGATLTNVDLTGVEGASEWLEGTDGLYPKDGATENVMVGGTTLASSTITLESNGTLRAVRFSGDFSGASNIYYNQEWNDQGSYMFPFDLGGAEGMLIGGNTAANADSVFNPDGSVVINEQAQNADTKVEGQTNEFLFHTDGSSSRVSINTDNPRSALELNGSLSFATRIAAVSVGSGLAGSEIQNSRVIFLESTGSCNVDFTASPQIAAGEDGQIITLIGRYSDEAITLDDGDGLALADNTSLSLRAKDSITLMYVASLGEWIEIHRTNYIERAGDTLNRGTCT